MKQNISMPRPLLLPPPPRRALFSILPREARLLRSSEEKNGATRRRRRRSRKKGRGRGVSEGERKGGGGRKGEKSGEGFRGLDYRSRILLITGVVLRGRETKRFPFNCAPRPPVHSAIVLSKNLITGAYGRRYPRVAADTALPPSSPRGCTLAPVGTAITHETDMT